MAAFAVFTVGAGTVEPGADCVPFALSGAGVTIPAITIGEEGRGRALGVLPVSHAPEVPCPDRFSWSDGSGMRRFGHQLRPAVCPRCGAAFVPSVDPDPIPGSIRETLVHPDEGVVFGRVAAAELSHTRAGRPSLIAHDRADSDASAILVLRTPTGFRGSNHHTGDRIGDAPPTFLPFPGEVLAEGAIAQGIAGRMGGGTQLVAVVPRDVVFRTAYSGRMYGAPAAHYYMFDGRKIVAATWDERLIADILPVPPCLEARS